MSLNQQYRIYVTGSGTGTLITELKVARVRFAVTDALSSFVIWVPNTATYNSSPFSLMSDAFIWFGDENATFDDYQFKGKIETIRTLFSARDGWVREFRGRDYGEVLFRRQLTKVWQNPNSGLTESGSSGNSYVDVNNPTAFNSADEVILKDQQGEEEFTISAISGSRIHLDSSLQNNYLQSRSAVLFTKSTSFSDIIMDIANNCGLGTGSVEADSNYTPFYETINRNHFVPIKEISNLRGKDFYVDTSANLQWFTRQSNFHPLVLKRGVNIISLRKIDDVIPSKNIITIYGAKISAQPPNYDEYGESLTNWTAISGSLTLNEDTNYIKLGGYSIYIHDEAITGGGRADVYKTFLPRVDGYDYTSLRFWMYDYPELGGARSETESYLALLAPDTDNMFTGSFAYFNPAWRDWSFANYPLGEDYTRDSYRNTATNETPIWGKVGNPDWRNILGIRFLLTWTGGGDAFIDVPFFYGGRLSGSAEDTTAQGLYEVREYTETDDELYNYWQCVDRANIRLNELRNPTSQIEVRTKGNMAIKAGDRIRVVSSDDGIDQYYDVLETDTIFRSDAGFYTTLSLAGYLYQRAPSEYRNLHTATARFRTLMNEKALAGIKVTK